jgi:hypothetical protein
MNAKPFAEMIVDNFLELSRQARDMPLVMGIALHPYIVGQPYRLLHLREALHQIVARRDELWLTTSGKIAAHCISLPEGTVP